MKKILAFLAAAIVAATVIFSGAHPKPKYENTQNYHCELSRGRYIQAWLCSHVQTPDVRQVSRFWRWFERQYKIDKPVYTTITHLPQHLVSSNFSGIYLPNSGTIIVTTFSDDYFELYVMAHEMLHVWWHQNEPDLPFGKHHKRIYCDDVMKPVENYLQKADPRDRVYISPTTRKIKCGPEI